MAYGHSLSRKFNSIDTVACYDPTLLKPQGKWSARNGVSTSKTRYEISNCRRTVDHGAGACRPGKKPAWWQHAGKHGIAPATHDNSNCFRLEQNYRVGFAPTEKCRLRTVHTKTERSLSTNKC